MDAGTVNYRELYWRVYVHTQAGWKPNGNDKFTRAIVFAKSDWSEAAMGHVWAGSSTTSQNYLVLDPASGTDPAGNLVTVGYNDFAHLTWLGAVQGQTPVFGSGAGQWYCVEAHMRLNDAGQSNGVLELWINGTRVAQGPSFAYPDDGYYLSTDITKVLRGGGANAIGALYHWSGAGKGRPASEPGVIVQVSVEYGDGTRQLVTTDGSWRVQRAPWLPASPRRRAARSRSISSPRTPPRGSKPASLPASAAAIAASASG